MKNLFFLAATLFFILSTEKGFSQADCQTSSAATYFFTSCTPGTSYSDPDNYEVKINNNQTLYINGNVTITDTLFIHLVGSTSKLVIQSPYTLQAGTIIFSGSATGKVIEVEGPDGSLIVDGTLDFGGLDIELDGEGTIDAGAITGADQVNCQAVDGGSGTCPLITADECNDGTNNFCENSLPVELLSFTAHIRGGILELRWSTASEENFDYFTIERSRNAKHYEYIGTVENAGAVDKITNYNFTDINPLMGRAYYRLKATDLDGTYEYFQPIMVNFNTGNPMVKIMSNPVTKSLDFTLNYISEEEITVSITDLSGVEVYRGKYAPGMSVYKIDATLDKGMYLLKVHSKEGVNSLRFIKN